MMKYAVNQRWKFDNYKLAFLPGFLQVIAMVVITLINFVVIMISTSIIDIAKDFTALLIISDFDNISDNLREVMNSRKKFSTMMSMKNFFSPLRRLVAEKQH